MAKKNIWLGPQRLFCHARGDVGSIGNENYCRPPSCGHGFFSVFDSPSYSRVALSQFLVLRHSRYGIWGGHRSASPLATIRQSAAGMSGAESLSSLLFPNTTRTCIPPPLSPCFRRQKGMSVRRYSLGHLCLSSRDFRLCALGGSIDISARLRRGSNINKRPPLVHKMSAPRPTARWSVRESCYRCGGYRPWRCWMKRTRKVALLFFLYRLRSYPEVLRA